MIASIPSATIVGARGYPVSVEVHVGTDGLPGFTMLGLPDESCREARDRVRSAIATSNYPWPNKKITVNLAPPLYRKTGSGLDVAVALGVLAANGLIEAEALRGFAFAGELGLDGSIRRIPGVAPMVGVRPDIDWVVPVECVAEARAVGRAGVRPIDTLVHLVEALTGVGAWPDFDDMEQPFIEPDLPDLADVKGQPHARFGARGRSSGRASSALRRPTGVG